MTEMKLQNVRKAIKNTNNLALEIMTRWENVCKDTISPEEDFDYIPVTEKYYVSGLNVKDNGKYKTVALNNDFFIDKKDDLIAVLEKMYKLYNLSRVTFLIVGDPNNPLGVLNHSDLNSLPFLHLMWDVFYNFETKLANSLKDRYDDECVENMLEGKEELAYIKDKKNNQELKPIFYLGLKRKIKLYNKLYKNNKINIEVMFRNNMAHPKSKAKVINNKNEIPRLYKTLVGIDDFLSL